MIWKLALVAVLTWQALVTCHLLYEIVWIVIHYPEIPLPCGKRYCPQTWGLWLRRKFGKPPVLPPPPGKSL
jgi:hypothetical protein